MTAEHTKSIQDILTELASHPEQGLTSAEAAARLDEFGPNEIRETISRPAWKMFASQFVEPLILILVAATALSFVLGNVTEGVAILAIVFLFGLLGFVQEYRAEKALATLKQLSSPMVRVRRDGTIRELPARELVPGDIILLSEGNSVPADLRLIFCMNCGMLEASLTGESEHIHKDTAPLPCADAPLGDRINLAYMGTSVVHGRAEGIVIQTGMRTELGKIAEMLYGIKASRTPLQVKLSQVGAHLSMVGVGAALALMAMGLLLKASFAVVLLTSVSLLVAVVPEGLPAIVTISLAMGGRRMLKRRALIRKLPAVETLGAVTVICSDKTGTLTQNQMAVAEIRGLHYGVTQLDCQLSRTDPEAECGDPAPPDDLWPVLVVAALCNDANLTVEESDAVIGAVGDPTEKALLMAVEQMGLSTQALAQAWPREMESAFDPVRRRMSTFHREKGHHPAWPEAMKAPVLMAIKGAPDEVVARSTQVISQGRVELLTDGLRDDLREIGERMATAGQRVLAVAFRRLETLPATMEQAEALETDLVFCGLIGLLDPPREEVREAIAHTQTAGIRTIMITGDHPLTAAAIARDLNIPAPGQEPRVLTGLELAKLSDEDLRQQVDQYCVFARVSPEDKLRIVSALQDNGQIVAVTGDGVNDAPALRRADIGVAMGIMGTDTAREASAMVLLDDNFATIVSAIEEGRTVFDNLIRFIKFSFGGNIGKVLVMLLAPLFGIGPIALLPLHLLWLNLLTDGLLGLGLSLEPPERDVMRRPPRAPATPILTRTTIMHMLGVGLLICGLSLALAKFNPILLCNPERGREWHTILFSVIGFVQMGQAWALRARPGGRFRLRHILPLLTLTLITLVLHISVITHPRLQAIFNLGQLTWCGFWASALGALIAYVIIRQPWRR